MRVCVIIVIAPLSIFFPCMRNSNVSAKIFLLHKYPKNTHTCIHTHAHAHAHAHTHTHTRARAHTHARIRIHTHTHTLPLSLSHSPSHSHTHTHTVRIFYSLYSNCLKLLHIHPTAHCSISTYLMAILDTAVL